jgi:hypothetical protein
MINSDLILFLCALFRKEVRIQESEARIEDTEASRRFLVSSGQSNTETPQLFFFMLTSCFRAFNKLL